MAHIDYTNGHYDGVGNLIGIELTASRDYDLTPIGGTELVAITQRNVAIVEAMIRNDSAYIRSNQPKAKIIYKEVRGKQRSSLSATDWRERVLNDAPFIKYGGSTAYWMEKLKRYLLDGTSDEKYSYEEIIFYAISAIDRENSTHLNADGVGRMEITERILEIPPQELTNYLKEPAKYDYNLIKIISKRTRPQSSGKKPRVNYSFATKFCHYACFYLFNGYSEQDNFSIFDSVMEKALIKYIKRYKLNYTKSDFKKYPLFLNAISEVISKSIATGEGTSVSRNGLDHLLWYYYKGRLGS